MVVALPSLAAAQTFPRTSDYVAFPCGGGPMVDAAGDTANATGALDLVGNAAAPAGFHFADAQFLYLRLRVAASPIAANRLQADAWGYEFDLDGNRATYELLISASGTGATDEVAIYRHPTTAVADDPADPSIVPPAFTYAFSTHGQVVAAGTSLGGADTFIDVAVPWSDLGTVGLNRDTVVGVWAGSSTVANALDLDLACFGGAGGKLSNVGGGTATPDPNAGGGGGGGGGPGGTGPRTLEGGPGCSLVAHGAPDAFACFVVALALLALRRRRV